MKIAEKSSRAAAGPWLANGSRLLITLAALFLVTGLYQCTPRNLGTTSTAPATSGPTATASLRVEMTPRGARVVVDGLSSGTSPLTINLPAGPHAVRVEQEGYEPLVRDLELAPGEEAVLSGELRPLNAPPTVTLIPTPGHENDTPLPDLRIRSEAPGTGVRVELETGSACDYASTELGVRVWIENAGEADAGPFVVDVNGTRHPVPQGVAASATVNLWVAGYATGGETRIVLDVDDQVDESDEENNLFQQMLPIPTLPPTCTPPPDTSAPPPTTAPVSVRETQVTIPTYPYAQFLQRAQNEQHNMHYDVLDWTSYEASSPAPVDVHYRLLNVENEYLKLTFLPEVGGRLYEVIYKPTGHRETYRNPVLKPSPWGPAEVGWWLAAGGIEWGLPVREHGYEWGVPWQIEVQRNGGDVTVLLHDSTATDRVRAEIAITLRAGTASFAVRPRIENPTDKAIRVKYWTNAMLAPGPGNAPSADLRFVLPDQVSAVTIHSRGDEWLPAEGRRMEWPTSSGTDLSCLGNWNRWLGFFEDPSAGGFVAVYDEKYDEGMVRAYTANQLPGVKVFALGWQDPIPTANWTDAGGGSYVELHSGPAPTFDDETTIPAGDQLEWTEIWYPVAGLGGLRHATEVVAMNLDVDDRQARIAVAAPRPWTGDVALTLDGQDLWHQRIALLPGQPFHASVSVGSGAPAQGELALQLRGESGEVVAEYRAAYELQ